MIAKYRLRIVLALLIFVAAAICLALYRHGYTSQTMPTDNSINGIAADIKEHAASLLDVQASASNTSYWVTHAGYMVDIPDQVTLLSYLQAPSDPNAALSADHDLTRYVALRLTNAGFTLDSDDSSTSTDNGPFYKVRIAFVSPDGALRCVIEPPDPTQAQIQVSWTFSCADTQEITEALQSEFPFLEALGNLKGAAVSAKQQGQYAAVGVFGEVLGYYNAIMIKTNEGWTVIYDGQEPPSCSLMTRYRIPESIYQRCY